MVWPTVWKGPAIDEMVGRLRTGGQWQGFEAVQLLGDINLRE
jgi:hypothetical protein